MPADKLGSIEYVGKPALSVATECTQDHGLLGSVQDVERDVLANLKPNDVENPTRTAWPAFAVLSTPGMSFYSSMARARGLIPDWTSQSS